MAQLRPGNVWWPPPPQLVAPNGNIAGPEWQERAAPKPSNTHRSVNHKRVARLMREHNIVGVHLRRPHITMVKDPGAQVFSDLGNRDFTATEVGATYVGGITYLPYGAEGETPVFSYGHRSVFEVDRGVVGRRRMRTSRCDAFVPNSSMMSRSLPL